MPHVPWIQDIEKTITERHKNSALPFICFTLTLINDECHHRVGECLNKGANKCNAWLFVAQDDLDSPSVCAASAEQTLKVMSSAVTQKVLTWQEVNMIFSKLMYL